MTPSELSEKQAFMILNDLPNIGPISLNRLLEEFGGDPRDILASDKRRLESVRGIGPETSAALLNWRTHFDLAREEERLAQAGATFITTRDEGYPRLLKEIHDPPIGLYRKGEYLFDQPCIAVVGSRRTTLYGQTIAKKLGADLAVARLRRKESLKTWAGRMGVSVPTLQRLEAGDPSVGIGLVATALWLIQRDGALGNLAAPEHDLGAIEMDVREAVE